jgi:uncharacterized protein
MNKLSVFISGLLFGAGLAISGMVNPMKVLNFLDIAGSWDASLIFVMGAGLVVTTIGYRTIFKRPEPLFERDFKLPLSKAIDAKLIVGSGLFGLGWGMSGLCPGPAISGLVFGRSESLMFVGAMAVGMIFAKFVQRRPAEA